MSKLNVMAMIEKSRVNGPGERFVIWTQGCSKACHGCFNPESWSNRLMYLWDPKDLAGYVKSFEPEGLTISGGDPLEQAVPLLEFLKELHEEDGSLAFLPKGILVFTGYTREEIEKIEHAEACMTYIDLLVDGRFVESARHVEGLSGSENQRFFFNPTPGRGKERIGEEEVEIDQEAELHIGENDVIEVTGFPDIDRTTLRKLGISIE